MDKFDSDKFDFIVELFDMERKHTDMELSRSHRCALLSRGEEILSKTLSDHHYPTPTKGSSWTLSLGSGKRSSWMESRTGVVQKLE